MDEKGTRFLECLFVVVSIVWLGGAAARISAAEEDRPIRLIVRADDIGSSHAANVKTIHRAMERAIADGADILLAPEGSLSGYTHQFDQQQVEAELKKIVAKASASGLALALGTCFVEPDDGRCYNQIRFYDGDGTFLGFHNKILRCGSMTDPPQGEINHYAARPLRTFQLKGITIGGLICNDMWANPQCTPMPDPHLSQQLSAMGAKIVFQAINGGRNGSGWSRNVYWPFHETNLRLRAKVGKLWIVTADSCHPTNIPCSAPSGVLDPNGKWVAQAPNQGEHIVTHSIQLEEADLVEESQTVKRTYTYKTVDQCAIRADVYRTDDNTIQPAVVWIHGGALIMGNRLGVPKRLRDLCRDEGFVLISLDYRLAPEVQLPAIIEDIRDAFRWIHRDGPKLFHIDPNKMVVAGGSAGGYLTMMTGICVKPRPTALVAYWGYGDVDGTWYTRPSEFYRKAMPLIQEDEARSAVGHGVIAGTDRDNPMHKNRGRYYLWLRQNGRWTREVTGFDAETERDKLTPYCPVRNITADYPPILMIHGTKDTDVPHELSATMAEELARHQVSRELISVPEAGHGLAQGDPDLVQDAHDRGLAFIRQYLQ